MYPAESNHLDSLDELNKDNVRFVGAFADGEMLGCGAVKLFADYAEIKRVYVPEIQRGRGIARAIMAVLERFAVDCNLPLARLETGIYQPEAIALYEALEYVRCGPFGDYGPDPVSVFMEKKLAVI